MNEFMVNMYVVAIQTGRLNIEFVPVRYKELVQETLDREIKN